MTFRPRNSPLRRNQRIRSNVAAKNDAIPNETTEARDAFARSAPAPQSAGAPLPLAGNAVDRWLARLSFVAQIATPALAAAAFFYTVVPLWSKAVLEEQYAKLQIDTKTQNERLVSLTKEVADKQRNADALAAQMSATKGYIAALQSDLDRMSQQRKQAQNDLSKSQAQVEARYRSLRTMVILSGVNRAESCGTDLVGWIHFYSPIADFTSGAAPLARGARYPDLSRLKSCVRREFESTTGYPNLSDADRDFVDRTLREQERSISEDLDHLDARCSAVRDQYVEHRAGQDAAAAAIDRLSAIGADALHVINHATSNVESAARTAGLISQTVQPTIRSLNP